jgi:hypothetical protein
MTPHLFPPTVNCEGSRRFSMDAVTRANPTADATPTNIVLSRAHPSPDAAAPRKIFETRIASSGHRITPAVQRAPRRNRSDLPWFSQHSAAYQENISGCCLTFSLAPFDARRPGNREWRKNVRRNV